MPIQLFLNIDQIKIEALQKKFNLNFPDDYIYFLKSKNGLFTVSDTFCDIPFEHVSNKFISFQAFDGIDIEGFDLIKDNENYLNEIEHIPNSFIIGCDPGGNFFVLVFNQENPGVYYWDRTHLHIDDDLLQNPEFKEIPKFKEIDEEGHLYFVAESFQKFYDMVLLNISGDKSFTIRA